MKAKPKKKAVKTKAKQPARAAKPAKKSAKAKAKPSKKKPAPKKAAKAKPAASPTKWLKFVEQHGVVLASAKGPVPNLAEQIAGEPIVGSWWSHPKAQAIFDALCAVDDSDDVRCFKLIDGKVTF